jgi:hypothetical protein
MQAGFGHGQPTNTVQDALLPLKTDHRAPE